MSAVLDSGVNSHPWLSHGELRGRVGVLGVSIEFWDTFVRFGGVFGGDVRPGCMRFDTSGLGSESMQAV
jgi:hypothetical protein